MTTGQKSVDAESRRSGARDAALAALLAIEGRGIDPKRALHEALGAASLAEADRALATTLVYGVTRERRALDAWLAPHAKRKAAAMDAVTRNALRLAAFQIRSLDRVPERAAVHEAVEQAKRLGPPGAAGFVNAVLRSALRGDIDGARTGGEAAGPRRGGPTGAATGAATSAAARLARRFSFPEWIVRRWLPRYGRDETEAMLSFFNRPPVTVLRVNRTRASVADVIASLAGDGVVAEPGRLFPDEAVRVPRSRGVGRLRSFRDGWVTVQDESSLVAVAALDPHPGQLLLDVAAAPGGKATYAAERMAGRGRVVANEREAGRAERIRENAARLGLANVEVHVGDARRLPGEFGGAADRALADVPCSGLGVLHRRADARWRKHPDDIGRLASLEFDLALAAAACLRPGGVMVYSTCTTEPEENQDVVARLLAARPDLALDDLRPYLPGALRQEPSARDGWLQLLPQRHGVDGFFLARLVRTPAAIGGP